MEASRPEFLVGEWAGSCRHSTPPRLCGHWCSESRRALMVAVTAFHTILLAFFMNISLYACLNPPPGLQQPQSIEQSLQSNAASAHVPGRRGPKSPGGALRFNSAVDAASSTDARVGVRSGRTPRADKGVGHATAVAKQCGRADRQQPCHS